MEKKEKEDRKDEEEHEEKTEEGGGPLRIIRTDAPRWGFGAAQLSQTKILLRLSGLGLQIWEDAGEHWMVHSSSSNPPGKRLTFPHSCKQDQLFCSEC